MPKGLRVHTGQGHEENTLKEKNATIPSFNTGSHKKSKFADSHSSVLDPSFTKGATHMSLSSPPKLISD